MRFSSLLLLPAVVAAIEITTGGDPSSEVTSSYGLFRLDGPAFNKLIRMPKQDILIKVDRSFAYGDVEKEFQELVSGVAGADNIVVGELPVGDFGVEKDNKNLLDRLNLTEEQLPAFLLFRDGREISRFDAQKAQSEDFSAHDLAWWLKQNGVKNVPWVSVFERLNRHVRDFFAAESDAAKAKIRDAARAIYEKSGLSYLKHTASEKYEAATRSAKDAKDHVVDTASEKLGHARDSSADTYRSVKEKANQGAENAQDGIHGTYDSLKEKASNAYDTIKEKTGNAYDAVKEKTSDIYESAKDQPSDAKDKASRAYDATKEKSSDVYDSVKDQSSRTYDAVKDKAGRAYDATKEKSGDIYDSAKDQSGSAYDTVKDKASRAYGAVKEKTAEFYDAAKDQTATAYDTVKDKASRAYDAVKEKTNDVYDSAKDQSSSTYDAAKDKAAAGYEAAKVKTSNGYDAASQKTSEVYEAAKDNARDAYVSAKQKTTDTYDSVRASGDQQLDSDNVKQQLSSGYDAAKQKVSEGYEAAKAKVGEAYDALKEKTSGSDVGGENNLPVSSDNRVHGRYDDMLGSTETADSRFQSLKERAGEQYESIVEKKNQGVEAAKYYSELMSSYLEQGADYLSAEYDSLKSKLRDSTSLDSDTKRQLKEKLRVLGVFRSAMGPAPPTAEEL